MANSLIVKSAVGLGGATSVIAATAIGMFKSSEKIEQAQNETEEKLVKTRGYGRKILTFNDSFKSNPDGKANGELYKEDNKNANHGEDTFKLSDGQKPTVEEGEVSINGIPKSFVDTCSSRVSKASSDISSLSDDEIKYCTKNITLFDLAVESGRTPLFISASAGTSSGKEVGEKYRSSNKEREVDAWGLENFGVNKDKDKLSEAPSDFRKKCDENLKSIDISNKELLGQVIEGCTVETPKET